MNYNDLTTKVTARLVSQIETGPDGEWSMPWHRTPSLFDVRNAVTNNAYRGANWANLATAAIEAGYPTSVFGTYRQLAGIGAQVRRGEKATQIIRWVTPNNRDDTPKPDSERLDGRRMVPVVFSVFNVAQTDRWEPPAPPQGTVIERDAAADEWIAATGAVISYGHNHAAYLPTLDRIELPAIEQFRDSEAMYSTTLHELAHWTGSETRIGRDLSGRFGDDAYAAEELIAELSSAIACAHLGIEPSPRDDHAHSLNHWLQILEADPKALFATAAKAQAAVDYLQALQPAPLTDSDEVGA